MAWLNMVMERICVLWDDGHIVPHPPVRRGLEEAKQALIAAGYKGEAFFFIVLYFLLYS